MYIRKRNIKISFRFSEEEALELDNMAAKADMLRGEFVRQAIHGATFNEAPPESYYEILKRIKQVGSLIDQVLKLCRENGDYIEFLNKALELNFETEQILSGTFTSSKH